MHPKIIRILSEFVNSKTNKNLHLICCLKIVPWILKKNSIQQTNVRTYKACVMASTFYVEKNWLLHIGKK